MTSTPDASSPEPQPSPPPRRGARYWVLAVLASAVGLVLVVVLYDREVLPIAGPFALIALSPFLLPLMERGQRKKAEREARKRARRDP